MNGGQRAVIFLEFFGLDTRRRVGAIVNLALRIGPGVDMVGRLHGNRRHRLALGRTVAVVHPTGGVLPGVNFVPGQRDRQRQ